MLAFSLMLPLSLLVSVSFCLYPLVFVAWLWLLSLALFPPGVLGIMQDDYPAFFEDMREGFARLACMPLLRSVLRSSALMLAPGLYGFLLCFHSLYAVFRFV